MNDHSHHPIKLAIAAIGGQGGSVLANWIVATAERRAYQVQATSVAGVAQRTGATIYYIEMMPPEGLVDGEPVFALYPVPGDLDVVIAGELLEAGRAIQRGFVTPDRTALIASSHRVYSTIEKSSLGDGTLDGQVILEVGAKVARRFVCFDMAQAADHTQSVISSVLLGALAGSACLPFSRKDYEASIRADGRAVNASLAGFSAGFAQACAPKSVGNLDITLNDPLCDDTTPPEPFKLPLDEPVAAEILELVYKIEAEIPPPCQELVLEGLRRVVDYQDVDYGKLYLSRLDRFHAPENPDWRLLMAVARLLALRMSYEDTVRVAELKTRPARIRRLRQEVKISAGQLLYTTEFMRPRVEEVCATLPARLGAYILGSARLRAAVSVLFGRGRKIKSNRLPGFLLLYLLASLKRWRRGSYRFVQEDKQINVWLERIQACLPGQYDLALEIARCADLIKGYGDTHARGLDRFNTIMKHLNGAVSTGDSVETVRTLRRAALADEEGVAFTRALSKLNQTQG